MWSYLSTQLRCGPSHHRMCTPRVFINKQNSISKVAGNYPAFCGTHTPTLPLPPQHLLASPSSTCSPPQPMDPLKRSPAKNIKSTETADTTTYQAVGDLTNKRSVVITGGGAYDFSRKLLLDEESFGSLIHATRTCRETPTPARSQRARFALIVTQRRSRRSSSAWYAVSRSTEPLPSGRSWRGTNWTTRDSRSCSKAYNMCTKNDDKKLLSLRVREYTTHTF